MKQGDKRKLISFSEMFKRMEGRRAQPGLSPDKWLSRNGKSVEVPNALAALMGQGGSVPSGLEDSTPGLRLLTGRGLCVGPAHWWDLLLTWLGFLPVKNGNFHC